MYQVLIWVVFFGRCLAVIFVELMNLPSSLPVERWLFMAPNLLLVIVGIWGF